MNYPKSSLPAGSFQAESRALPFARRRLMTLRPALVDIRLRNPWFLARLRLLGWKVRFIFNSLILLHIFNAPCAHHLSTTPSLGCVTRNLWNKSQAWNSVKMKSLFVMNFKYIELFQVIGGVGIDNDLFADRLFQSWNQMIFFTVQQLGDLRVDP